jgi:hypothetical protein
LKFYKIFLVFLFICSFLVSKSQLFYVIPKNTFQPYLFLGKIPDVPYGMNIKMNYEMELDSFEISHQITYGDYKNYLNDIKKDSSLLFYLKQLPDSTIASKENYAKYTTGNMYDSFPVMGISWEAAMNFCKWKTINENEKSSSYICRLPLLSEWLFAYSFFQKTETKNDLNKYFSDWTLSNYYEGGYFVKEGFSFDIYFFSKENDPPRRKRKVAMGDSYFYQKEKLCDHWRGLYSFTGYRQVAFRIIKQKLNEKNNKVLNENIMKLWNIKLTTD